MERNLLRKNRKKKIVVVARIQEIKQVKIRARHLGIILGVLRLEYCLSNIFRSFTIDFVRNRLSLVQYCAVLFPQFSLVQQ